MGIDDIVRKAKEAATDERIDQASQQLRKVAPDKLDRHIDSAADQAKKYNEDDREPASGTGAGPAERRSGDEAPAATTSVNRATDRVVPPNSADPGPETGQERTGRPPGARP